MDKAASIAMLQHVEQLAAARIVQVELNTGTTIEGVVNTLQFGFKSAGDSGGNVDLAPIEGQAASIDLASIKSVRDVTDERWSEYVEAGHIIEMN